MAAPAITANAIKIGTLLKLGVIAAGETASASDDALVESALDRMLDAAERDGDVGFYRDDIPDDAQEGLIVMLAAAVAADFGYPADTLPVLQAKAEEERRRFRRHASIGTSDEPVPFVSY